MQKVLTKNFEKHYFCKSLKEKVGLKPDSIDFIFTSNIHILTSDKSLFLKNQMFPFVHFYGRFGIKICG